MVTHFGLVDKIILFVYFASMILLGAYFRKRSSTPDGFMTASGQIPSFIVGLSILGTFVSSITFIAYPGQAYNFNWDAFIFSLTLPFAATVAMIYFIPLYRTKVKVSAYEYLEQRFGGWARVYGSISFMFGSLTRMGMILFLVSLVIYNITGWSYTSIILLTGISVMFYTLLGGMAAVIWTDVIQVVIFVGGAFVAIAIIVLRIPGGPSQLFAVASDHAKFSLGSWRFDLITPTAWVVLLYGIMENLRNFGVDQNYVQRYLTTPTVKDSAKSVWTAALGYIPVSAFFLFIGTGLFAFYKLQPNLLDPKLQGELMGDKIFPFFITTQLPVGVRGILIAALLAAAMSTVSSSLNCVSTLTLLDFYKKYVNKDSDDRRDIQLLRWYTIIWGILGTITGLAMIKVKTALETGWQLGGIAGGGVIGLFLLGIMFKRTKVWQAVVAVIASVIAIAWATFARHLPEMLYLGKGICYAPFGKLFLGISLNVSWLECTWHTRMIGVIGTITLLVVGIMLSLVSKKKS